MQITTRSGRLPRRGASLYYVEEKLEYGPYKASIAILHGGGEHLGRYDALSNYLASQGYYVVRHDMRGAGRSTGPRWHINSFSTYIRDLHAFFVALRVPPPLFLLGHGVGALLALSYALNYPQMHQGLILLSPFLRFRMPIPSWKDKLARCVHFVLPRMKINAGRPLELISRDPEVVESYRRDKLCYYKASLNLYTEVKKIQAHILLSAEQINCPLLLIQGGRDGIADSEVNLDFFRRVGTREDHKKLLYLAEAYHVTFNEPEKGEVMMAINDFILVHIDDSRPRRPSYLYQY
ncbi:MAG TPA: alpha/beta hydrolase [Firmicutes bacterium]|nr:alpha/beta hydrolase [Bacillota bacterium]